ncbi:MAG: sodium:proton antiporter [Gammaproteobacteria bacterium]|nr:MAG: sodium:proton antiporter [Gammaproteobacteria bacterium]
MSAVVDGLAWAAIGLGVFVCFSGAFGLLRFPDFYSRLHAAGVTDTLGAGLVLLGLMLQAGWSLAAAKLALILLFAWVSGPTASHVLARAARHDGLEPWTGAEGRRR